MCGSFNHQILGTEKTCAGQGLFLRLVNSLLLEMHPNRYIQPSSSVAVRNSQCWEILLRRTEYSQDCYHHLVSVSGTS